MITTVTFERRTGNANNGKIIMAFLNNGSTSTIEANLARNIRIRVTAPTGVIYDTITSGDPDFTGLAVAASGSKIINIPAISGSDVTGDYVFEFKIETTANTADNVTLTAEYEYCPENRAVVRFASNCAGPAVQLFDRTNYTGYILLSRVLTLVHPEVNNVQPTNSTTGGSMITIAPTHSNVVYTGTLSAEVRKQVVVNALEDFPDTVTFIQNNTWGTTLTYTFQCATSLKDLAKCYQDKLAELNAAACRVGGYRALTKQQFDLMAEMQSLWVMYTIARDCGDYDKMNTYYNQLKALLNCNCCGAGEPAVIEPLPGEVPFLSDSAWADVDEAWLRGGHTISGGMTGGNFLRWKIVGSVLYLSGAVIHPSNAYSKLPREWLSTEFVTSLGVSLTELYHGAIFQEVGADVDNVVVGWAYVNGNGFYMQLNPAATANRPIRINLAIPLA
jgi:hypothetical protein